MTADDARRPGADQLAPLHGHGRWDARMPAVLEPGTVFATAGGRFMFLGDGLALDECGAVREMSDVGRCLGVWRH